jgi:hypothetical protein
MGGILKQGFFLGLTKYVEELDHLYYRFKHYKNVPDSPWMEGTPCEPVDGLTN